MYAEFVGDLQSYLCTAFSGRLSKTENCLLKERKFAMIYSAEVQNMCSVAKGAYHGPAPIPEEGKWVQAKEIKDISGFTHGIGWCAPQQGACKLTLNIKEGVIEEALVETIGCSGISIGLPSKYLGVLPVSRTVPQ